MQAPPQAPAAPREEYARRLDERRASLAERGRRHNTLGFFRMLTVFSALAIAYAAIWRGVPSGWWLLVPAVIFFWLGGRLQRVLTTDPGSGVMRHVDAGYDEAVETAVQHGIRIPMLD